MCPEAFPRCSPRQGHMDWGSGPGCALTVTERRPAQPEGRRTFRVPRTGYPQVPIRAGPGYLVPNLLKFYPSTGPTP